MLAVEKGRIGEENDNKLINFFIEKVLFELKRNF
jgi:hypothetical protein